MRYLLMLGIALVVSGAAVLLYMNSKDSSVGLSREGRNETRDLPIVEVKLPESLSVNAQIGETGFNAVCAACHGINAAGKDGFGPPLIHKIYEPSHHSDQAFQLAVIRGVQAHHWPFGNMPPQASLSELDVKYITAYVRELQRANGIE